MEKEISFKNEQKQKISGYLHVPEKPNNKGIVLAHCFTCSKHIPIIKKMCDYLADNANYLVLRFDFSGNGESEGKFEESTYTKQISDFTAAIDFMSNQKVDSIGALGHSMGAAVAILGGVKNSKVSAIVTLGGDSSTEGIEQAFDKKILRDIKTKGLCTFKIFGKKVTLTKEFFNDSRTHNIEQALSESKKPIHIIHGEKDEIIPVENAKSLYKYANSPKKLTIIQEGNHMFTKSLPKTLDLACEWFSKYLK